MTKRVIVPLNPGHEKTHGKQLDDIDARVRKIFGLPKSSPDTRPPIKKDK